MNGIKLLLRIVFGGFMLAAHGVGKIDKLFQSNMHFADPLGIGEYPSLILVLFAEVLCTALIVMGLFTKWATVPLIITMLVAVLIVHKGDAVFTRELPILYLAAFSAIGILGSGKYSLDFVLRKKQ